MTTEPLSISNSNMKYFAVGFVAGITVLVCSTAGDGQELSEAYFKNLINNQSYDCGERPVGKDGKPLTVKMQLEVGYLGTINSKAMTFEAHLTLRHWWKDSRLEFNRSLGESVVGQLSLRDAIWTPTLFFHNEKESELVQTTKDNIYVKVGSNGEVYMAVRFRLTLSCPMNLVNYPMDTQHCSIRIMSWFYDVSMLILQWKDPEKCLILPSLSLPEHSLDSTSITCDDKVTSYNDIGNYSGLKAFFTLEREFKYYMIEVYVPVMLLVIVSWISFWLDIHAVPARVALGITTILTVITNSRGVKDSIPRVSYIKAVDVWYLSCTLLVFFAFLEFPLVNFIARKARSKMAAQMTNSGNQNSTDQNPNRIFQVVRPSGHTNKVSDRSHSKKPQFNITPEDLIKTLEDSDDDEDEEISFDILKYLPMATEELARSIDRFCRGFFPLIFALFNLVYWITWSHK